MPRLHSNLPLALVLVALAVLAAPRLPASAQETPRNAPEGPALPSPADTLEEAGLPYETTLRPTGDGGLDTALGNVSALRRLQRAAPTTAEGLVARALQDRDQLVRALRAEGYYDGTPVVLLADEPPDAPQLALRLAQRGGTVPVVIGANPGTRYTIGTLRVTPEVPEADITSAGTLTGLDPGDPARAQGVIDAGERLLTGMRETGHPFAAVARREVTVDHDTRLMDVTYVLQPGPRARFATPEVEGATRVDPKMLRAVAGQLTDREYDPRQLDRVRRDFVALGVFSTARTRTGEQLDASGRLPVTFLVAERPRRALGITGAYETRNGPTVTAYWEHRNLFGGAERLRLEAQVGRTSQSSAGNDLNARVSANLRTPWVGGRNLTLVNEVAVLRERLLAYDRDAITANASVETKPDPRLTVSGGLLGEFGRTQEFETARQNYQLVGLLGTAVWDDTDSLLDATRGYRANALVSPIYAIDGGSVFTRLRIGGSAYYDVTRDKGTVLAGRVSVGSIVGASTLEVPPHLRFFAGGGGSVRGYDFQRIGPRRANDTPRGGRSLVEASVELRQRISGPIGMVAFVDGGSVEDSPTPGFSELHFGAGLGVRYATAIGPIRADVALPLSKVPGNSGYGLYIGIGQAF
ncbi:autotransporter assembly complex protein TamA [Roseomonas sp. BN140053]|uniref:autotransporter assembly complex protein TamA n=1 Tax=Roseomonas sp. BN140053 TaxID=3391898 RepID=UPI0039E7DC37